MPGKAATNSSPRRRPSSPPTAWMRPWRRSHATPALPSARCTATSPRAWTCSWLPSGRGSRSSSTGPAWPWRWTIRGTFVAYLENLFAVQAGDRGFNDSLSRRFPGNDETEPIHDGMCRQIEGCSGIGHHVAVRLLAEGEEVVDVPPKLSARTRVFATGQGRKTDATDAHSVALVGNPDGRPASGGQRRTTGRAASPGRSASFAGRGPHADDRPIAAAAARAHPGRREKGPLRSPGQGIAGEGPPTRHCRKDPPTGCSRGHQ